MTRFGHRLKGNKAGQLPHSCIWFDTETEPFKISPTETGQRLVFGWAAHQYTKAGHQWTKPAWLRFETGDSLIDWIENRIFKKTRTYIFAHNYHFETPVLNLFDLMDRHGWELHRTIIESPPFILAFRKGDLTLEFLDTGNWWLHSAAKIGDSVGVPKLPMPEPEADQAVWDTYCKNDVEIIRVACLRWFEFIHRYDLGGFARTLAGQAFKAYRHRFMSFPIFIDDHEAATRLGRRAYHGGRTECFHIGRLNHRVHVLDINSQYPFVMQQEEYPTRKVHYSRLCTVKELSRWLDEFSVVADCDIETDSPQYAHIVRDKICFPVGRFREALTTPDLKTALNQDHVKHVHEIAIYERAPIFRDFVTELYRLRLEATHEGNEVMRYNLKILMNSLYGKFGQAGRIWKTVAHTDDRSLAVWDELDVPTGKLYNWRRFAGLIQLKEQDAESYESFPAIAAHVTAFARRLLWKYLLKAGRGNTYYCDTDSVFVNDMGKNFLEDSTQDTRLGALSSENTFDWLHIYGPKDYQAPDKRVTKGVKAKAEWIDESTIVQEQWAKLPGMLRRGNLTTPVITQVTKHLRRVYDKGTVTTAGSVEPLALSEW